MSHVVSTTLVNRDAQINKQNKKEEKLTKQLDNFQYSTVTSISSQTNYEKAYKQFHKCNHTHTSTASSNILGNQKDQPGDKEWSEPQLHAYMYEERRSKKEIDLNVRASKFNRAHGSLELS